MAHIVLSAERLRWRAVRAARNVLGLKRTTYLDDRVAEYRGYWQSASDAIGASFHALSSDVWEIRKASKRTRIANYRVQLDDPVTLHLAGDKPYCASLAQRFGIPTAANRIFTLSEFETAWRFMAARSGAFVVKPANRSAGVGVTVNVCTRHELGRAAALASLYGDRLVIECLVPAESCRLLYLDGKLIHAVRRRGVRVIGDGRASLEDLLFHAGGESLLSDAHMLLTLQAQGFTVESVLPAGKEVVVRYLPYGQACTVELRTVYNECITEQVCPELALSLAPLVEAVGSRFAGVDVLTNDPGQGLEKSGGVFLEVNTTPAMHHHYIGGEGPSVAIRILSYLLEEHSHEERRDRFLAAARCAVS